MKADLRQIIASCLAIGTFGLICYSFSPVIIDVAAKCWSNDDYSHGLLLPFVCLALFWLKRDEIIQKLNFNDANHQATINPEDQLNLVLAARNKARQICNNLLTKSKFCIFSSYQTKTKLSDQKNNLIFYK